jgi:hypothetical protein
MNKSKGCCVGKCKTVKAYPRLSVGYGKTYEVMTLTASKAFNEKNELVYCCRKCAKRLNLQSL